MNPPILVGYSPQTADRGPINFGVAVSRFTGAPLIVAAVFPGGSDIDGVSRQVTASASCPVLVLPRGAEEQLDALLATAEGRAAPEA